MKNKSIAASIALVLLVLVAVFVFIAPVSGNKVLINDIRPSGNFSSVRSTGMVWRMLGDCELLHVEIHYGPAPALTVSGEASIVPHVMTSMKDSELLISLSSFVRPTLPIKVIATINPPGWSGGKGPRYLKGMACSLDMAYEFGNSKGPG